MKLVELITFFRQGGSFEDFCQTCALDAESEVIEIYTPEPQSLDAELGFFPIEKTEGRVEFQSQGVTYRNLFDFFYFLEVIEDMKAHQGTSNEELAEMLFAYAIKDA